MSRFKLELCSCVVKEHYGELVEKVAMFIAKNGPSQLKTIIKRSACDVKQVSSFYRSRTTSADPHICFLPRAQCLAVLNYAFEAGEAGKGWLRLIIAIFMVGAVAKMTRAVR